MFLFLLLLCVLDDTDQLFMLDIFERSFDRDEALGVLIMDPVTSRTESFMRACRFRFPGPPSFVKDSPACWTDSGLLELPLQLIGVVFILLKFGLYERPTLMGLMCGHVSAHLPCDKTSMRLVRKERVRASLPRPD